MSVGDRDDPQCDAPALPPRVPESEPPAPLDRAEAEALGQRIQQQAAVIAEATCELLLMVGDFDARGGLGWFGGLKSTANWLSWSCSMSPGTAREHVRAARALPEMPSTVAAFRAGARRTRRSGRSPAWPIASTRTSSSTSHAR